MTTAALKTRPRAGAIKTGISDAYRKDMSSQLAEVLGDTMALMSKTQVFHWNVVGPVFLSIHNLTEEHYKDLFAAADDIAERIRGLGFPAPLSMASLTKKSHVVEEDRLRDTASMIETLVDDHEGIAREVRAITSKAADEQDFVTHDLLNARLAFHEKAIWMLRAIAAD